MIGKAQQSQVSSRARVTFWDPATGERVPAHLPDGTEFWGGRWHPNLITDAGLDHFGSMPTGGLGVSAFWDSEHYRFLRRLSISDDLPEVKESSGSVQANQSGNTVTADASFFTADDVGRAIVWADGSSARITAYSSGTTVTVDKNQSVPAQAFERWHVEIDAVPGLIGAVTNSGSVNSMASVLGNDYAQWTLSRWHQYEFTQNRNVTGFALGDEAGTAANVVENIRDASGSAITVSILAGKAIRVDHELVIRLPLANQVVTLQVDEYDAADQLVGSESYQADLWPILEMTKIEESLEYLAGVVNPAGMRLTTTSTTGNHRAGFLTDRVAVPGVVDYRLATADVYAGPKDRVVSDYVPSSRRRTCVMTGAAEHAVGDVYGAAFNRGSSTSGANPFGALLLQLQEGEGPIVKAATHTLSMGYEISWDRDYTVQ